MKGQGCSSNILKRIPGRYMYQDPVFWSWIETFFAPKKVLNSKTSHEVTFS